MKEDLLTNKENFVNHTDERSLRIVLIDDDALVSSALKTIIESSGEVSVAAVGNSGEDALALYDTHLPDIMLLDIRMGGLSGLDAGEKIIAKYPEARLLFLTTFADDEYIMKALKLGAKGYILKQHYDSLLPALKAVANGQRVFGDEIVEKLPNLLAHGTAERKSYAELGLLEKEYEIITHVASGFSNKEIAAMLFLSEGTVRNYISAILEKLDLRDRTQLAIFYFNNLA